MDAKVREILDKIDDVLADDSPAGRQLWEVLTALRGPDSGNTVDKKTKTVPIRRAAFPKTAAKNDEFGNAFPNGADFGSPESKYNGTEQSDGNFHFYGHAFDARYTLGI